MANEPSKFAKTHKFHIPEVQQTSSEIDKTDPHLETNSQAIKIERRRENFASREGKMTHLQGNHNKLNNRIFKRNNRGGRQRDRIFI